MGKSKPSAVVYARTASVRQAAEGASIELQKQACIAYCNGAGYEVESVYGETSTAKDMSKRKELNKLLEYCRKNKGKVDYLVIYKFDRLSRKLADHLWLRKKLTAMGITVKSTSELLDDNSVERKLQENIASAFAEYDKDVRSKRIHQGIQAKKAKKI